MDVIEKKFSEIKVQSADGVYFLHKPILLIFSISHCYHGRERLISFNEIDRELIKLFEKFYPAGLEYSNTHYPFGKLENDDIWEIEKSCDLKRTSVGHLSKKELFEKNIHGGFTFEVYQALSKNKSLLFSIFSEILIRYFPPTQHDLICVAVNFPANFFSKK